MMKRIGIATLALLASLFLGSAALAANCTSYTYTLTNGQTADATQVMANFNTIMACANTNLAHNGANSDITSLSGLLTPLSASQGGTGQATSIFSSNNTWAGTQALNGVNTVGASTTAGALMNLAPGVAPTSPNNGDLWTSTVGIFARINGVTQQLNVNSILHVRNQQTQNTSDPETFTGGTWNQRTLNTTVVNTITGATLGSNQVSLPAGTYIVTVWGSMYSSGGGANDTFIHRVRNVTDSADLVRGSTVRAITDSALGNLPNSTSGVFTITGTKTIEIDVYSANSSPNVFGGVRGNVTGYVEDYLDVMFQKIG